MCAGQQKLSQCAASWPYILFMMAYVHIFRGGRAGTEIEKDPNRANKGASRTALHAGALRCFRSLFLFCGLDVNTGPLYMSLAHAHICQSFG